MLSQHCSRISTSQLGQAVALAHVYSVFLFLQASDRHLETAGQSEIFQKYPRKASILNMPLVTTLFYSCFYHYTEAEVRMMWEKKRVTSHPCGPQCVGLLNWGTLRKGGRSSPLEKPRATQLLLSIWHQFGVFVCTLRWNIQPGTACQGVAF